MHSLMKLLGKHKFLCTLLLGVAAVLPCKSQVAELHKDCGSLSAVRHWPDYKNLPAYTIERREYTAESPRVLTLQVSTTTKAIGGAAIVRLACKLASEFPRESAVRALIFDDKIAARNLAVYATDQTNHGLYLWHLKGRYVLDRTNKTHFVEYVSPAVDNDLLSLRKVKSWLAPSD